MLVTKMKQSGFVIMYLCSSIVDDLIYSMHSMSRLHHPTRMAQPLHPIRRHPRAPRQLDRLQCRH
jgi:hypothetical protein